MQFHSIPPGLVALGSALCAGSLLAQAPLRPTHACAALKTDCRQVQRQGLGSSFPAYEVNPRGPWGLASESDPNGNAGAGRRIWSIFRF